MNEDGSDQRKISVAPISGITGISPDGNWVAAWVLGATEDNDQAQIVYSVYGGTQQRLCDGRS